MPVPYSGPSLSPLPDSPDGLIVFHRSGRISVPGCGDLPKLYDDGIQANNHDEPANEPSFYIRKGYIR